jgi:hypothetical protein
MAKEPWQMTRDEYLNKTDNFPELPSRVKLIINGGLANFDETVSKWHDHFIASAIEDSKSIPDNVLKEYLNKGVKMKLYLNVTKPDGVELDALSGQYSDLADALKVANSIDVKVCERFFKKENPEEKLFIGQTFVINLFITEDETGQIWKFFPEPGQDLPPCIFAKILVV